MLSYSTDELATWCSGTWIGNQEVSITGFAIDARKISKGEMFVALKAERDGHDFAHQAMNNGASSVLVSREIKGLGIPQLLVKDTLRGFQNMARERRFLFDRPVIGITGSCGKTSTKDLLSHLLGPGTLKTEGNLNNHLGVPLTIMNFNNQIHSRAVVEVGINSVGEMKTYSEILNPEIVIITMIGQSHLEGLKTTRVIAEEKAKLFQDSKRISRVVFFEECLKYDCFSKWRDSENSCLVLREGEPVGEVEPGTAHYQIWTETNKIGDSLMLRLWQSGSPTLSLSLETVSKGMCKNLALAVLVAGELGVSEEEISERLPQYRPSALRGKFFRGRGRTYFVDCYNANPSSMKDSLQFFSEKYYGLPKLFILGGMEELGPESENLHREVGEFVKVDEDDLYVMVGEKARWYANGLLKAGAREEQLVLLQKLEDARSLVEDFEGAIIFKGSRKNKLENLLPSWAVDYEEEREYVEC